MSLRASRFISRAPRYTLRPSDNHFMRFAYNDEQGHSYTTRFLDISRTGLAFVTDREVAPQLSDLIKVEIPLDNQNSIAWWARVVRVEEYAPHKWYMKKEDFSDANQVLVALTFHELPPGHARQIHDALKSKFDEQFKTERRKQMEHLVYFAVSRFWTLFIYGVLIAASFWFLHYLAQPSANYDEKKGSPWGRRFPNLYLPVPKDQ